MSACVTPLIGSAACGGLCFPVTDPDSEDFGFAFMRRCLSVLTARSLVCCKNGVDNNTTYGCS